MKSSKISGHLLLRDSNDPVVSASNPVIKTGNWKVGSATSIAEAEMAFQQIQGPRQMGRNGLGIAKLPPIPEKNTHAYRKMVSATSRSIDEELDSQKALQLTLQCSWMSWENYIKNNLSWSNILAMPPNLLSFCIGSTFNVLPSPSNLHRWHRSPDLSCSLCGKNICTVAHILGACSFSLKQGRFTYRHDSVLSHLVSTIENLLKDSPKTKSKKTNKINFIREGQKPPNDSNDTLGIRHLSSDWILLADLQEDYIFPFQIAVTQLRPDVVLYSKALKRVILLELTSPCEENMNMWHMNKLNKYGPLKKVIESNQWHVDLFGIEVGARGYVSITVTSCLKRLGFPKSLIQNTVKSLGRIAMESSFCIWLCRDSKNWQSPSPILESKTPNSHSVKPKTKVSEIPEIRKQAPKSSKVQPSNVQKKSAKRKHVGFINKGNTCYANAILQALSTIPSFWCQQLSESGVISPLARSVSLNLSLLGKRSSPIDPSNFLRALQNLISRTRNSPFNVNTMQDASEILQIIIDELKGTSILADDIISSSLKTITFCEQCNSFDSAETKHEIIQLPLTNSITSSLNSFLSPVDCRGSNKCFCGVCNSLQNSVRTTEFSRCGNILVLQLIRYVDVNGKISKDNRKVNLFKDSITIPVIVDNVVSMNKPFKLRASINHSGTLNAGHYWAFIKEDSSNSWLKCNDTSVIQTNFFDLQNDSSYIFVYSAY